MKHLSADDSADSRVKVGHRQAIIQNPRSVIGGFFIWRVNPFQLLRGMACWSPRSSCARAVPDLRPLEASLRPLVVASGRSGPLLYSGLHVRRTRLSLRELLAA